MKVGGVEYHIVQDEKGCDGCDLGDPNSSYCKFAEESLCDLPSTHNYKLKNPHPHRDMIKEWADDTSLAVEAYDELNNIWITTPYPKWYKHLIYRFRPKELDRIDKSIKKLRDQIAKLEERKAQLTKGE